MTIINKRYILNLKEEDESVVISKYLMTNKEFFDALGNPNPICLVNNNKRIYVSDIPKYIDNYDIFFIPNIGGTKKIDITDFKCFFVDFDCGRDKNDNFYPLNYVKKFKDSKLQDLKKFEIQPNAIIETRNGLHAYWFIREEITYEKWNFIEKALIRHFNTDKKVSSPANQLRLPNSTWFKDKEHPFKCSILSFNDFYTNIETYCNVFNLLKNEKTVFKTKYCYKPDYKTSPAQNKPAIKLKSYKEVFDYLTKKVSMFDYLKQFYGLEGENQDSFCCLFHNDEHSSASIFKTDSGIELYYCRTNTCNFIGNIIQVVGRLKSVSRSVAINILCQDLNIEYREDIEAIKFLLDNIRSIDDDIELSHRDLYGVIYRYIPTLKEIHSIALRNIIHSNYDTELVFSASVGYVAKALNRDDKKSTCADINLFCLLNLLTKLDLEEKEVADKYKKYITRTQKRTHRI